MSVSSTARSGRDASGGEARRFEPGSPLALIGLRGSGKTTVGRLLAGRIGRNFVDTDDLVEQAARRAIRDIFERDGEARFRELERRAVADALADATSAVVSVGGGAVLLDENRRLLRERAACIWLTASAETLHRRIDADPTTADRRPPLIATAGVEGVRELLAAREPYYRETARHVIDTEHLEPDEIVERIVQAIGGPAHGA